MSIWERIKNLTGMTEEYEDEDDEDDGTVDEAYSGKDRQPEALTPQTVIEEERRTPRRVGSFSKISNVVGMPGIMNGASEMILIEPRSFDEMPQVIDALRSRKSVILNMTLIRQEEAQRSVDFVSGGTYAIDGHYERIGDNIFLFTPSCVQVSTPGNVVNEIADRQAPINPTTRSNRNTPNIANWNEETTIQAAQ